MSSPVPLATQEGDPDSDRDSSMGDASAPNDETQNEMLDIGHHMYTLVLDNKLFLAPINPVAQNVLDVGTGTGIWAIDFADEHPSATITGTDLSPIQPTWVPPNLKFEIDDAELDWTWADNWFDFVHMRALMGSIKDWPRLFSQAFRCTKPGGYIESFEVDIQFTSDDGSVRPGTTMYDWSQMFIEAGESMGQTFQIASRSKKLIEEAGFVDVEEKKFKLPVGAWMQDKKWKEIGRWNLLYLTTGLEGMQLWILKTVLGWEYTEIQALSGKMRSAFLDRSNHAYYEM
ncbi:hypothetical protein BP5796_12952 [Coleophoma crateriformis]|uniref:S-adenosyl-L-methionine-dependent methyltransferase n=1 Tax=Coleophoma crateriformis TaxID=565419 RepID=A0A3D8Q4W6_9HELO|nr:hypothetical protein BP5796_12952 [Coleophoma crateriformis]